MCVQIERQKAMRDFSSFTRGSRNLLQAVKDLKLVLLECHKQKYKPDDEMVIMKFESLVPRTDFPLLNLYQMKVDQTGTKLEVFMRAIEDLAIHQDGPTPQLPSQGGAPFDGATGAAGGGGRRGTKNRSKGFRGGQDSGSSKCKNCGIASCPAMKGEGRDKCHAYNKECKNCNKKGHFAATCRQPKRDAPRAQAGVTLEGF